MPALEVLDRSLRLRAEVAAHRAHVELALERLDGCPAHPVPERVAAALARKRDSRGYDEHRRGRREQEAARTDAPSAATPGDHAPLARFAQRRLPARRRSKVGDR